MEPEKIAAIVKLLKMPENVGKLACDYLKSKSKDNYNKLEIALKAYGFTVQQFLDKLDDKEDLEFISSYRETNAINTSISIIKDSNEFSDAEKCKRLNEIHDKEIEQQNRGEKYKIISKILAMMTVCIGISMAILTVAGIIRKQNSYIPIEKIPQKGKNRLSLPFKKK